MTYFRMGIHTIIGVPPFHGPVRDGKAWFQRAMVVRRSQRSAVSFQQSTKATTDSREEVRGWIGANTDCGQQLRQYAGLLLLRADSR